MRPSSKPNSTDGGTSTTTNARTVHCRARRRSNDGRQARRHGPAIRSVEPPDAQLRQVGPSGIATWKHYKLGIGTDYANQNILILAHDREHLTIYGPNGLNRDITIDPGRRYQPSGLPPVADPSRNVNNDRHDLSALSRENCQRCPATSQKDDAPWQVRRAAPPAATIAGSRLGAIPSNLACPRKQLVLLASNPS